MILVVEDNEAIRSAIALILSKKGHDFILARDGGEALALWALHRESIRLLFTDVVMPQGITGIDLAEKFRGERPGLRVVFCSGYGSDLIGDDVLNRQGNYFIAKPFDATRLASTVAEALA